MIQIIYGEKGTGKTKKIIALANSVSESVKGSTIFIDDDNSYMYDLSYSIRFVNVKEYGVTGGERFLGFLGGLCASDYDLECVFVDRFIKIVGVKLDTLESFFADLNEFSEKHNLRVVLAASENSEQLPEFVRPYLLKEQ